MAEQILIRNSKPLFPLGRTVMTRGVEADMPIEEVMGMLARHERGDWGKLDKEDWLTNECALKEGARLLSAYQSKDGVKVWIITEWDRSVTTVLLPEEY